MIVTVPCPACGSAAVPVRVEAWGDTGEDRVTRWIAAADRDSIGVCDDCGHPATLAERVALEATAERCALAPNPLTE
jgi:hypothetical protein